MAMLVLGVALAAAAASPAPAVHDDATFAVRAQLGVPYGLGVVCDPKPCTAAPQVRTS